MLEIAGGIILAFVVLIVAVNLFGFIINICSGEFFSDPERDDAKLRKILDERDD